MQNMFAKLMCLILNLFLFVSGENKTNYLVDNPLLDVFKENQNVMYSNLEGSMRAATNVNQSYYSIIAPGILKSNRKYTTVASLHDAAEPCLLRISILGAQFHKTEEILLRPFESKTVDFYPPKLVQDIYTLVAEGVEGCSFKEYKQLLVENDAGPKIYIQTDKAVYKPEDLVQFRVLFLDEHTKPLNIAEPILVEVLDAKENIVKTFKDVRFKKGVYTNSFSLSERPVLGSWSIRVSVSGMFSHSSSKAIQVKRYILPKFSVHIRTAKHVVTSDVNLKAMIFGKYTFGKYVQGIATVQLWNKVNTTMLQELQIAVNTLAAVEFPLANLKRIMSDNYLNLLVTLRENFTGIVQSESIQIMLHTQRYNIIANVNDFEFLDLDPYRLKVQIQHWNGAAVMDPNTAVILKHGHKTYETHMEDNGVATFEFESQKEKGYFIFFKDSDLYIPNVYRAVREENSSIFYCKLKLLDPRLHLGKPVKIEVSSSENIPHLVYAIVGHGNIIRMQQITLPPNQKSYIIHIKPAIEMIPLSYIYVHYSHNGILRYNDMELVFPRQFENQISLVAPLEVKPGQEITVELKAQPQSFVGILAVDLGVHMLDPSYDLDRNKILNELAEDKSHILAEYIETGQFLISGLVVLTNINRKLEELKTRKPIRQSEEGPLSYRTQFPEVWIFQNFDINATNTKMTFKLPDSITTWRITAFSINDKSGLGIVEGPTDITAIKPFFITLNLPYSIKWGEIVAIGILVFNYHSQSLDSSIVMLNNELEFEFMESMTGDTEKSKDQQRKMVKYVLPANDGKMFTFYIKPLKVGNINLRISASNYLYIDAVHQQLKVESQGIDKKYNQPIYLNVSSETPAISSSFRLDIPSDVEPTSCGIALTVGGDYIVPTLDNLQQLVEMPTGCGEQNMVNFAPNILILQYLKATGEYSNERKLVATIKSYIDIGYQQQLSYRHANGGYSVFGESVDEEASTWLTAYSVRFFIKASKFASIELRIIERGLEYLSNAQLTDGSFPYTGYLFQPAQENRYGLTAFILATFLEDRMYARQYQKVINSGLQFLTNNLDDVNDVYSLSITVFVLQMAKNSNVNKVLEKLQIYRKEKEGLVWWSGSNNSNEHSVEITAYILMALLDSSAPGDHKPILKWLIAQRNDKGGFLSTHDTVVGLQALVKFAQKIGETKNVNLDIKYTATDQKGDAVKNGAFKVESGNYLMSQKQELPQSTRNVSYEMTGSGSALLQLSHHYKILDASTPISPMIIASGPKSRRKEVVSSNAKNDVKYFIIEPKASILNNNLDLEICYTYTTSSNMVIMEVNLPSGYRTDDEVLEDLQSNAFVQRIEPKKEYTTIMLYLDKLAINKQNCINILAYKTNDVVERKSVPIMMYDYYNKTSYNSIFYNI
ncbi:C3 and PZP-like alpha-2-macroglobulin domain-containing protein 8 [Calliphora vicina]|uniref:C3 and PZP-like alpha-2-macroglobulin domain-containing protein 8 n=1 Tax=Calliphora vicina TaxID=7373 RepID=UPI00325C1E7C